jgi:hypothetical protein
MGNENIPFAAVIGGFWSLDQSRVPDAKATAKTIGAELAKANFGLVVYFSNEQSLEPHVVSGYCAIATNRTGLIRVRYAESQRAKIRFKEETAWPELFEHRLFPGQDWEGPFYRSLAEEDGVDALVLLGGGSSSFIAGQIAIARRLPILAVDQFGGSGEKIWNQVAQVSLARNYDSWGTRSPEAFVAQLKEDCYAAAEKRAEVLRREQVYATVSSKRLLAGYASAVFVVLLAMLFLGMVYIPFPSAYPFIMFLGLIASGATGALIRAIMWGPVENDPRISLLLGGVSGFVIGVAYLIPQWIGAPGVLVPKTEFISDRDKIQFAASVLVAISAGVGFDTVFNRLRKQAEDTAIGPPR